MTSTARQRLIRATSAVFLGALVVSVSACSSRGAKPPSSEPPRRGSVFLPSENEQSDSPFKTFDDAMKAYQMVIPDYTSVRELEELGFHPSTTPNVERLAMQDIIPIFMPSPAIRIKDLDDGIQKCIRAKSKCYAYRVSPAAMDKEHVGNVFLDITDFKDVVDYRGWKFQAIFLVIDDVVAYKDWSGQPNIASRKTERKPLGFMDGIKGLF